mgnify:CR=1 FL=1
MGRVIGASAIAAFIFTSAPAGQGRGATAGNTGAMAKIAQEYVRLVLAMGQHDTDSLEYYYGRGDLKKEP